MPKKPKFNNEHKVPSDLANEIWGMNNKELISKSSLEYANWEAVKKQKKEDSEIIATKSMVKQLEEQMKEDPQYIEAEEKFKALKESLVTEDLARYKEELKNLNQPYSEDIRLYEGMFKVAMDEVNKRKKSGMLTVEGKII